MSEPRENVLGAAGAMGAATFISRIMGLVREQVFAFMFGAGSAYDAYTIAFRMPNLLRDLFAEGAMSASVVPTFTRVRIEKGDRAAWRLAGLVFRSLLIVVGVLTCIGIFFSEQLVSFYASAYKAIPGKFELTVEMTRIMFPFFPFVVLAAGFMGILNACGKFFLPAFASALFNIVSVVSGVTLALIFGQYGIEPIKGMAIGVVLGGAVQALCQLPALYRAGYKWPAKTEKDLAWNHDPHLRNVMLLMLPGTVGLAATQVNVLINSILATSQGTGAVSWLNYAFRLMQFPIGVFGVSFAAATLPLASQHWVKGDASKVTTLLGSSLRNVFAINLPAAAGLAFLSVPIIRMLFEYGRFTSTDTLATAGALAAYAVGLPAYSAVKVLVPVCYAIGITRKAVTSSVLSVVVTIALNLALINRLGYIGLALGTSAGAIFNALWLLFSIRSRIAEKGETLPIGAFLVNFLRHLVVALLMGAACWFLLQQMDFYFSEAEWLNRFSTISAAAMKIIFRTLKVSLLIGAGVLILLFLAKLTRLEETTEVVKIITKKVKNKLNRKSV
ncbi:murein biosynthesis integral membrane protein MurJ [bacterium]|nr:murein biosynthesis integral membrane protein MurJ [bacterium]